MRQGQLIDFVVVHGHEDLGWLHGRRDQRVGLNSPALRNDLDGLMGPQL